MSFRSYLQFVLLCIMQALWLLVTEWIGYQIIKSIVAPLDRPSVFKFRLNMNLERFWLQMLSDRKN